MGNTLGNTLAERKACFVRMISRKRPISYPSAYCDRAVVIMGHCNKKGESKILKQCNLPLTGKGVVDRVITALAVMDVTHYLSELAPGVTVEDVLKSTVADLSVSESLKK